MIYCDDIYGSYTHHLQQIGDLFWTPEKHIFKVFKNHFLVDDYFGDEHLPSRKNGDSVTSVMILHFSDGNPQKAISFSWNDILGSREPSHRNRWFTVYFKMAGFSMASPGMSFHQPFPMAMLVITRGYHFHVAPCRTD